MQLEMHNVIIDYPEGCKTHFIKTAGWPSFVFEFPEFPKIV